MYTKRDTPVYSDGNLSHKTPGIKRNYIIQIKSPYLTSEQRRTIPEKLHNTFPNLQFKFCDHCWKKKN